MAGLFSTALKSLRGEQRSMSPILQDTTRHIPSNTEVTTTANVIVTENTALQQITVFSCVRLLTSTISTLPLNAYRRDTNGVATKVKATPTLLTEPFAGIYIDDWLQQVSASLILRGNAYLLVVARDSLLRPSQLLPIHPDDVHIRRDGTGAVIYTVMGQRVNSDDIVHIRAFMVPGSVEGLSVINYMRSTIGAAIAADGFANRFFGDGATPSSVLETDKDLSLDQASALQETWVNSHQNRRKVAVLAGGLKWRAISITPEESQFLQTQQFRRSEIMGLFGIPPHMLGDTDKTTSWGTGIAEQAASFNRFVLRYWLTKIECALSPLLPQPQFAKFDTKELLRGTFSEQVNALGVAVDKRLMNPNEARAEFDYPPYDGGDEFLQPLNMSNPAQPAADGSGGNPNDNQDNGVS